eukprot:4160972-Amphidinium_carterae.1
MVGISAKTQDRTRCQLLRALRMAVPQAVPGGTQCHFDLNDDVKVAAARDLADLAWYAAWNCLFSRRNN